MTKYSKPYPTIRDLIKNKDYEYVSYRIRWRQEEPDGDFAGCFATKNGEIIPLDGDCYDLNEKVISSEEWSNPKEKIKNGLTIIVNELE